MPTKISIIDEVPSIGSLPIEPSFGVDGRIDWLTLVATTESGVSVTKAVFTRPIESFKLQWSGLTRAERDTLISFFDVHTQVTSFLWNQKRYYFFVDTLETIKVDINVYSVEIEIEEIPDLCTPGHVVSP